MIKRPLFALNIAKKIEGTVWRVDLDDPLSGEGPCSVSLTLARAGRALDVDVLLTGEVWPSSMASYVPVRPPTTDSSNEESSNAFPLLIF